MVSAVVPLLATAIWGCGLWPSEGNCSCLKDHLFLSFFPTLLWVTSRRSFLLKTLISFSMKLLLWQALIHFFISTQVCGLGFLYHPSQVCHTNNFLRFFLCLGNYLRFYSVFIPLPVPVSQAGVRHTHICFKPLSSWTGTALLIRVLKRGDPK